MTDLLNATEVAPKMRPYHAVQLTEQNISLIANKLVEYVYTDSDGNIRMSLGEETVPLGWWVVWNKGLTIDRNFYPDDEFRAMYEEKGANANRWPTESLVILLDASAGDTPLDLPEVAMRTKDGHYMLTGGLVLTPDNATIRNSVAATAMRVDDAVALLAEEREGVARPGGRLAVEAWSLINRQN